MRKLSALIIPAATAAIVLSLGACADDPASPDALSPDVLNARQARVDVCHVRGKGSYALITVAEAAVDGHLGHGDALPGDPVPGVDGKKFDETCAIVDAGPVVTAGWAFAPNPDGEAVAVRYRGDSNGWEIALGSGIGSYSGDFVTADYPSTYSAWQAGTYHVTFAYNPVTNTLQTAIDGPGGDRTLTLDLSTASLPCPAAGWNTMDINVVDRPHATKGADNLEFNDVVLDGFDLGDFDLDGWNDWTVSGYDFGGGFTLTGVLVVEGGWTGSEYDKVQITVGCL